MAQTTEQQLQLPPIPHEDIRAGRIRRPYDVFTFVRQVFSLNGLLHMQGTGRAISYDFFSPNGLAREFSNTAYLHDESGNDQLVFSVTARALGYAGFEQNLAQARKWSGEFESGASAGSERYTIGALEPKAGFSQPETLLDVTLVHQFGNSNRPHGDETYISGEFLTEVDKSLQGRTFKDMDERKNALYGGVILLIADTLER